MSPIKNLSQIKYLSPINFTKKNKKKLIFLRSKVLSADLPDKGMIANKYLIGDKYFIYGIFFIGDILY